MLRSVAFVIAILVASAFIFAFALIGVGSAPFVPLMLLTGVGWMHIAQDLNDALSQRAAAQAPAREASSTGVRRESPVV